MAMVFGTLSTNSRAMGHCSGDETGLSSVFRFFSFVLSPCFSSSNGARTTLFCCESRAAGPLELGNVRQVFLRRITNGGPACYRRSQPISRSGDDFAWHAGERAYRVAHSDGLWPAHCHRREDDAGWTALARDISLVALSAACGHPPILA